MATVSGPQTKKKNLGGRPSSPETKLQHFYFDFQMKLDKKLDAMRPSIQSQIAEYNNLLRLRNEVRSLQIPWSN